jgi:RNA polymerase sigma-70 factor (ECF subfamily)
MAEQQAVLERFIAAIMTGDIRAVAEVLHPDVVLIGDGGRKARTTRQIMVGADKIMRFYAGLLTMYAPGAFTATLPVLVNGDLGLYLPAMPATEEYRSLDAHVDAICIRDGKVVTIYDVANPDKLTALTGRPL